MRGRWLQALPSMRLNLSSPICSMLVSCTHRTRMRTIRSIDKSKALALPGVYAVLTYEDLPRVAHSTAGQPYPETSPYDAYLLDSRVRYVGDWVAFAAAETPAIAEEALSLIRG